MERHGDDGEGEVELDSRFHLTVKFCIYGQTYDWDCSLNWTSTHGEIDHRITEWFERCHHEAYSKSEERYEQAYQEGQARVREWEINTLKKLRAKYPDVCP